MFQFAVILSLAIGALGHNWVNCPSRSEFASTVNPSLPSQTGLPHVRVAADQDFQVEWVNGHDSDCYWVLMPEKDHMKTLVKMNTAALEDFINSAPEAQKVSPPLRWQKYHRKYNSPNLDNKAGDAFFLKVTRPQDNDPNFMSRPVPWEGSFSGTNTRAANYNISLVFQSYYHQNTSCAMNDRRVQYTNPKYPAIIAVHRYRLCTGQGGRPDVARLTFPAGTPPGRYVAWWSWRGYYDIVDVEVVAGAPVALPYGMKVPPPPAGVPAQYKRVDHCAWPDATPAGKCFRILSDARACMDMCDRLTEFACQGVGVVPVVYPASAYPGFKNVSLVPYEFAASCNKGNIERGANANHLLCFAAAARQKTETLDRMHITDDPDDPAFYSTCLIRIPFKDAAAGVVAPPPREPEYQFGKKCISCDQAQVSTVERQLMIWNITTNCSNCEIDGPKQPNPVLVQPEFDQKAVPWVSRTPGNYCYGINQGSNFSANYKCPNTTVNCIITLNPPGLSNADISEWDCYQLAKNDGRCGPATWSRPKGHPDFALCWCWRYGGPASADFDCCGPCDSRFGGTRQGGNSTNWILFNSK